MGERLLLNCYVNRDHSFVNSSKRVPYDGACLESGMGTKSGTISDPIQSLATPRCDGTSYYSTDNTSTCTTAKVLVRQSRHLDSARG